MFDLTLPVTSIFNRDDNTPKVIKGFHFTLVVDERTDCIRLVKYKENPSLKYIHNWLTCFEPEKHLDELVRIILEKYIKITEKSNSNPRNAARFLTKQEMILAYCHFKSTLDNND